MDRSFRSHLDLKGRATSRRGRKGARRWGVRSTWSYERVWSGPSGDAGRCREIYRVSIRARRGPGHYKGAKSERRAVKHRAASETTGRGGSEPIEKPQRAAFHPDRVRSGGVGETMSVAG